MGLENLRLKNFRGYDDVTLDFNDKMNVIIGNNGAGKSTIIDAVAILLSWVINRMKTSGSSGKHIIDNDVKNGTSHSLLYIKTNFASWQIVKTKKGKMTEEKSEFKELNEYTKEFKTTFTETDGNTNIPLFVYYPINRAVIDIPLRIRGKHQFDVLSANEDSLGTGANFRIFFEWFREREDLENETKINVNNNDYEDKQLKCVRTAWELFLPEFKNFKVQRSPLRLKVEKNGKSYCVEQLSDGEKVLISVVGDLARRLSIANPLLDNPLEGEGVVLIDEVDLHLHPKWQKMVITKLTEVFPNCQFIVSTHSPHVISHTKPENMFCLHQDDDKISVIKPRESYGKTVDRVLEDLMGFESTRPDEVVDKLNEIYSKIDNSHFEEARELISNVREEIQDDPELQRTELLIRRKEMLGK